MATIAALIGSPNTARSNTLKLVNDFAECVREYAPDTVLDAVVMGATEVRPCNGCWTCSHTGACAIADDLAGIHTRLRAADLVILATPVFAGHISAQTKTFIDRSFTWAHTVRLLGKPALTAVTAAFSDMGPAEDYLREMLLGFGAIPVGALRRYPYQPEAGNESDVRPLAERVASLLTGGTAVLPTEGNFRAFEMIKGMVRGLPAPHTQAVWARNGWYDKTYAEALADAA